jgi:hypothetical protein
MTADVDVWRAIRDVPGDVLAALDALLERPAWHRRAACRGQGPEARFPERHHAAATTAAALALCARCPVTDECAEAGQGEAAGIWGGVNVRAQRRRAAA